MLVLNLILSFKPIKRGEFEQLHAVKVSPGYLLKRKNK